jgi:hypothetical protein
MSYYNENSDYDEYDDLDEESDSKYDAEFD